MEIKTKTEPQTKKRTKVSIEDIICNYKFSMLRSENIKKCVTLKIRELITKKAAFILAW